MLLREALRKAQELGVTWRWRRGGELLFSAGPGTRPMVANGRRKDACRALEDWLRRLERRRAGA